MVRGKEVEGEGERLGKGKEMGGKRGGKIVVSKEVKGGVKGMEVM